MIMRCIFCLEKVERYAKAWKHSNRVSIKVCTFVFWPLQVFKHVSGLVGPTNFWVYPNDLDIYALAEAKLLDVLYKQTPQLNQGESLWTII
jgi:hypothetical protein